MKGASTHNKARKQATVDELVKVNLSIDQEPRPRIEPFSSRALSLNDSC